jgi:hypothetical protein
MSSWKMTILAVLLLASSSVRGDAGGGEWRDLLASVDLSRDTVAGSWSRQGEGLRVEPAPGARLVLTWQPTPAYDLEATFIRHGGQDSVALFFVHGRGQASLDVDGWRQHLAGIQNIGGLTMRDNTTRVGEVALVNGRRYTLLLRVRPGGVEALLDGRPLTRYEGDGSDLSMLDLWQLPRAALGLGVWDSAATFERVRVRTVAGEAGRPEPSAAAPVAVIAPTPPVEGVDWAALSDEFDDPATLARWQQVWQVEQAGADPLQRVDIGRTVPGRLTLVPHTSTWYQDYRGVLLFKEVEGDFTVTALVRSTSRRGQGAPGSAFSLAGLMVRAPRQVTPATWQPGGENYLFASLGAAREPGRFAFETKTTQASVSTLEIHEAPGPEARIAVTRVGARFWVLTANPGAGWVVRGRYHRPDLPPRLQVGMTVYTDWPHASQLTPPQHNTQVIRGGEPDLLATFDYVRFAPVRLTGSVSGRALQDADVLALQAQGD